MRIKDIDKDKASLICQYFLKQDVDCPCSACPFSALDTEGNYICFKELLYEDFQDDVYNFIVNNVK